MKFIVRYSRIRTDSVISVEAAHGVKLRIKVAAVLSRKTSEK